MSKVRSHLRLARSSLHAVGVHFVSLSAPHAAEFAIKS